MMHAAPPFDLRPDAADALRAGRPVASLTSAPIAHSLPWPDNLEIARQAQAAALEEGATLAILAVWRGRLTVGLTAEEVEELALGASALRASRRDLPAAVVRGDTAALTVAASMYLAHAAGIRVLAAGAIGGASRGEEDDGHISADLVELSRTPAAVVTAGTRSVSDLARTAEILEGYGVPVIGYRTDTFPAFYQRPASQAVSVRTDTPAEAAALLAAHWSLGGAGAVVVQPTPAEAALSPDELQPALREVRRQAAAGVRGKDLPPILMERLNRMTGGRALRAYAAALTANARLAAQIARELGRGQDGERPALAGRSPRISAPSRWRRRAVRGAHRSCTAPASGSG
jgi:pseudouridine-5'-phosphate glycosidase